MMHLDMRMKIAVSNSGANIFTMQQFCQSEIGIAKYNVSPKR